MIWAIVTMVALMAFVSLAIDFGRVQLVKTELRRAADAAARYGVAGLTSSVTTAQSNAVAAAADNKADNSSVVLNPSTDIDFGTWDATTRTFTVLTGSARSSANAMRITARRTAANGNGVPLLFGRVVGIGTCDAQEQSIATCAGSCSGFVGTGGISMHANNFIASYNSGTNPIPSIYSYDPNGTFGSNGPIAGSSSGNTLHGNVVLGSGGSVSGVSITGTTTSGSLGSPTVPAMTPGTNPGGVSNTPNVSGTVVWPGGTYYFTSWQIQNYGEVWFTGNATINLNGNGTFGSNVLLIPSSYRPGNLVIRQASGGTFSISDTFMGAAQLIMPGGTFTAHNSVMFGGSIFAKQITMNDSCELFYDESITTQSSGICMVK